MIKFLASVRDGAEAEMAFSGGAHVIDLKEPALGALGAVPDDVAREVVDWVAGRNAANYMAGRTLVSATIGDHVLVPGAVYQAVAERAETGVDLVKIGLFGGDLTGTLAALKPLADEGVKMIAVVLADQAPDLAQLVDFVAAAGFVGIMLDTAQKSGGGLLSHISVVEAGRFVTQARSHDLLTGLAGSLRLDDIDLLAPLNPDYLGFRGALCASGRDGHLDDQRLRRVAARIATAAEVTAA